MCETPIEEAQAAAAAVDLAGKVMREMPAFIIGPETRDLPLHEIVLRAMNVVAKARAKEAMPKDEQESQDFAGDMASAFQIVMAGITGWETIVVQTALEFTPADSPEDEGVDVDLIKGRPEAAE